MRSESELMAINLEADTQSIDILMKRIGIDFDCLIDTGVGSGHCKFLRVEHVILKLFKMYNMERDLGSKKDDGERALTEELRWLSESIWSIGGADNDDEYSRTIQVLALSFLFKVYFDIGLKLTTVRSSNRLGNKIPIRWLHQSLTTHSKDDQTDTAIVFVQLKCHIFWQIQNTLAASKQGRQAILEDGYLKFMSLSRPITQ